jgi:hypothetical protein
VGEFLDGVGFGDLGSGDTGITKGILAYNHQQRVASDSNWSFTIFVVNSANGGQFPAGGFRKSFAFAGGLYFVVPSTRPASSYAHEMGHIFYAFDEYNGGASHTARRGYYNTQNLNAVEDRPANAGSPLPSIMGLNESGSVFEDHLISPSAKEMVGWRDSDGDGIFDVLDVPLSLTGSGAIDPATGKYRFVGEATVGVFRNQNPSKLQSDITLNEVSRVQYRIDGGAWTDAVTPHAYQAALDFSFAVPPGQHDIEIRAIDDATNEPGETGVMSAVFAGTTAEPASTAQPGINGFLWHDENGDGVRDATEPALRGWTVEALGPTGQPLNLAHQIEPDSYDTHRDLHDAHPDVTLSASNLMIFSDFTDPVGALTHAAASTGTRVFAYPASVGSSDWDSAWLDGQQMLTLRFTDPVATLSIDAIGVGAESYARLEVYDANRNLLERVTTGALADGQSAPLKLNRPTADIKYAVISGHGNTAVRLDHLSFGPSTTAMTDANGAWSIPSLDQGDFQVQVAPPARDWQVTNLGGDTRPVSLNSGAVVEDVDFGLNFDGSPWQNPMKPADINGDDEVTNLDLLAVVQYLRAHPAGTLLGEPGANDSHIDATGDRVASVADLLPVVNALRDQMSGSGPGEGEFVPLSSAAPALNVVAAPAAEAEAPPSVNDSTGMLAESAGVSAIIANYSARLGGRILAEAASERRSDFEEALSALATDVALVLGKT